jgi:hypothetical protein
MSQGAEPLKRPLQHHPPIPLSLMIRFARFRRGDCPDPTALEIEGLHYRIIESGLRNKYGLFFILSFKKPYFV